MTDTRGTRRESQTDRAGKMEMWYEVMAKPRQERAAVSMLEKASIATYYPAQGYGKLSLSVMSQLRLSRHFSMR